MAAVPLQRPESFGTRNVLTDEEFAERQAQFARQATQDNDDSISTTRAYRSARSAADNRRHHIGSNAAAAAPGLVIVDPPNGRLPALTPPRRSARRTPDELVDRRRTRTSHSTSGVSPAGSPAPCCPAPTTTERDRAIAGVRDDRERDGPRIAGRTARGRPHLRPAIADYVGDSRGRWDGDTLVVETTNFVDRRGSA